MLNRPIKHHRYFSNEFFKRISLIFISTVVVFCIISKSTTISISSKHISSIFFNQSAIVCHWSFLNYTSSFWESTWYNNIEQFQKNVCERLATSQEQNNTVLATRRLIELQTLGRGSTNRNHNNGDGLLSRMYYREECTNLNTGVSFKNADIAHLIEPLIGLLRDPFTICARIDSPFVPVSIYEKADLQSKRFITLSVSSPIFVFPSHSEFESSFSIYTDVLNNRRSVFPWMYERSKQQNATKYSRDPQHILLDLGSSYFGSWGGDSTAAAGLWFYEYYKRFNIKFDRIIAFEFASLDPKRAWEQLPDDVFPVYTLINVGVTENGTFNPWNLLRAIAKSWDHVVVKVDIDSFNLENDLMNQILTDPTVHNLIDELFFEHHVTVPEMTPYWGTPPKCSLKTSLRLMATYRLHYFNARGRAEISRLIFAVAEQKYDDIRYDFSEWPTRSREILLGQVPLLEVNGVRIPQSISIARFLAKQFNIAGRDNLEQAKVDAVVDTVIDMSNRFIPIRFEKDEAKKKADMAKFFAEELPDYLQSLEILAKEYSNGGLFFVNNQLTWCDLLVYDMLENLIQIDGNILNKFSWLQRNRLEVEKQPRISKYLKTRAATPF